MDNIETRIFLKRIFKDLRDSIYFLWDIGKTLIFVVAIAFLIRFYLVQPFYVEGQSMEPSFNNGEYLLIDELSYHFRSPERGEVIVFHPPIENTYQNYIKRIIALPNEEIDFQNSGGDFVIKNQKYATGKTLEESYLTPNTPTRSEKDVKLGDQNYFVMGDNRTQSSDSRMFGLVFRKNITGRVWFYIKTEPWFRIPKTNIVIPKIKSMGKITKPQYKIDNLSFSFPQNEIDRNALQI